MLRTTGDARENQAVFACPAALASRTLAQASVASSSHYRGGARPRQASILIPMKDTPVQTKDTPVRFLQSTIGIELKTEISTPTRD